MIALGANVKIGPYSRIEAHGEAKANAKLRIGTGCSIEHAVHIYCADSLYIGNDCVIASGCMISDNNHSTNPHAGPYIAQPLVAKRTTIGKNVWLGENVAVLQGSDIGDYCVIGANSVVTGVIPPFSMAVGAPAKVIKFFDKENCIWVPTSNGDK